VQTVSLCRGQPMRISSPAPLTGISTIQTWTHSSSVRTVSSGNHRCSGVASIESGGMSLEEPSWS
jgi:hypothetical protein